MTLKTLDNALEILKYFTREQPAWGVRELAKKMNKSHSIVHRLLVTFESHGFLRKNDVTKKYELGLKFFEYGLILQDKLGFKEIIRPYMEELADESRESVFFTLLDDTEGVCIAIAESNRSIKFEVTIGSRTPLYAGASCKSIMAYLPEQKKNQIIERGLEKLTPYTIIDPNEILADLAEIKEKGWSYTIGEFTEDVVGVSVPVFDHEGSIFASLTIAAPSYRVKNEVAFEFLELLKITAKNIQEQINTYKLSGKINQFS